MSRKNDGRAFGDFIDAFDEPEALFPESGDDELVMDDRVQAVNVFQLRNFVQRRFDAAAKTVRLENHHFHDISRQIDQPPMPNARQISETKIDITRTGARYLTIAE